MTEPVAVAQGGMARDYVRFQSAKSACASGDPECVPAVSVGKDLETIQKAAFKVPDK